MLLNDDKLECLLCLGDWDEGPLEMSTIGQRKETHICAELRREVDRRSTARRECFHRNDGVQSRLDVIVDEGGVHHDGEDIDERLCGES